MNSKILHLSVLLIRKENSWVAQCLEYDIAAPGKSISAAKAALENALLARIGDDLSKGSEPLERVVRAPVRYRRIFDYVSEPLGKQRILVAKRFSESCRFDSIVAQVRIA